MRSSTALAVLAAVVALAGCGGGDEPSETTGAIDTGAIATTEAVTETAPPPETASGEVFQIEVPKSAPIGPTSPPKVVRQLQRALAMLGYKVGEPDGIYGDRTRKAVISFQKKHKLEADGLVGAKTAKAINKELREQAQQA
jgi:peptidoglycan hydrolase-like protein with peptidoglycan-binding domain